VNVGKFAYRNIAWAKNYDPTEAVTDTSKAKKKISESSNTSGQSRKRAGSDLKESSR
jgi:hypothetical protein